MPVQAGRRSSGLFTGRRNRLFQREDILVIILNCRKLIYGLMMLQYINNRCAVLLAQPIYDIHTALQLIEALRLKGQGFPIVPQLIRRFLELAARILNHLAGFVQGRIKPAHGYQILLDLRERRQSPSGIFPPPSQQFMGRLHIARNLFRIG